MRNDMKGRKGRKTMRDEKMEEDKVENKGNQKEAKDITYHIG